MLATTTVHSFMDINKGLAHGFRLITQALQLESVDKTKAQEARKEATSHLKAVVKQPHFSAFANHALSIYQDEVGEMTAPDKDKFERLHVPKEVNWDLCTVETSTGTDCLLEMARKHPSVHEQRRALEALREELRNCCSEVDTLNPQEMASLMMVVEMCNEIHNLNTNQLKKVIDKYVHKIEARRTEHAHGDKY